MWTYAVLPLTMQLTMLLALTSLGSTIGSIKEKTFVRKHRHRGSTPQQATFHADGQVDMLPSVLAEKSGAPSLAPLALGFTTPDGYFKLDFGADQSACGDHPISSEMECKHGAQAIGIDMEQGMWMGESPWWHGGIWQGIPKGCWVLNNRAYWNNNNATNTSVEDNDIPSDQISAHALNPVKRSKDQVLGTATSQAGYTDAGSGKCLKNGVDPSYSYHGAASSCQELCDASEACGGYSDNHHGNCLLWLETGLTGGGHDWTGAHCMVKMSQAQGPQITISSIKASSASCDGCNGGGCDPRGPNMLIKPCDATVCTTIWGCGGSCTADVLTVNNNEQGEWCSRNGSRPTDGGQWIDLDLGNTYSVTKFELWSGADHPDGLSRFPQSMQILTGGSINDGSTGGGNGCFDKTSTAADSGGWSTVAGPFVTGSGTSLTGCSNAQSRAGKNTQTDSDKCEVPVSGVTGQYIRVWFQGTVGNDTMMALRAIKLFGTAQAQGSLAQVGEKSFEEPVGANLAQKSKSESEIYLSQQFAKDSFPICRRNLPHLTSPDACGCAQCLWSGTCWPDWDAANCELYQGTWNCAGQVTPESLGLVQPVQQPKYYVMEAGTCCCPEYSQIKSENECREAVLGVGISSMEWSGEDQNLPSGCSAQYGSHGYFNQGMEFDSRGDMLPICAHAFGPDATAGAQFYRMPLGAEGCQSSHKISSVEECVGAAGALGLIVVSLEAPWVGEHAKIPAGCSHQYGGRAHWNAAASGQPRADMLPMCARPPTEGDRKYFRMPPGHKGCDDYDPIHSIEECKAAAAAVGFDTDTAQTVWEGISSSIPLSCSGQLGGRPHYNYDSVGGSRADIFPICKLKAGSLAEIHTEIQQETTSFYTLHAGTVGCPENEQVRSFDECKNASKNLGFNLRFGIVADDTSKIPGGCSAQRWSKTTWNSHQTGGSHSDSIPICKGAAPLPVA